MVTRAGASARAPSLGFPPLPTQIAIQISPPAAPPLEFNLDRDRPEQVLSILLHHARALQRAEAERSDLLFVYGYCLWRAGDADGAVGVLERYLQGPAALAPYAHAALGGASVDVGDLDAAKQHFAQARALGPDTAAEALAGLGEARLLRVQGNLTGAVQLLQRLERRYSVSISFLARVWLELGRTLEAQGHRMRALAQYAKLWSTYPTLPESEEASLRMDRLLGDGERLLPSVRYQRARHLWMAGRREETAQAVLALLADPRAREEIPDFEMAAAKLLFLVKAYDEALPVFQRVADTASGDDKADALLWAARTRGRLGDIEGAIAAYEAVAQAYPGKEAAVVAWHRVGLLRLDQGRYGEAEAAFERALENLSKRDRRWRDIPRYLAWTRLRQGKLEEADAFFVDRLRAYPDEPDTLYWHARLALARGDVASATGALRRLAGPAEPSYYAVLARILLDQMGEPLPEPEAVEPLRPRFPPKADARALLRTEALYRVRSVEWARWDARRLMGRAFDLAPEERVGWALWYQKREDHVTAARMVRSLRRGRLSYPGRHDPAVLWRVLYPRAYRDELEGLVLPDGVSEWLVYAVMRQESRFDRWAVSPAGARGPMQLMPETAVAVAKDLGKALPSARALHDPRLAVALGSAVLARDLERYGGNLILAIAAYNAGPQAVDRWLEERPGLPIDAFVEEISYAETRRYVRRVVENLWIYSRVYGDGIADFAAGIPLEPTAPVAVVEAAGVEARASR